MNAERGGVENPRTPIQAVSVHVTGREPASRSDCVEDGDAIFGPLGLQMPFSGKKKSCAQLHSIFHGLSGAYAVASAPIGLSR
jgi:hypothetical protein